VTGEDWDLLHSYKPALEVPSQLELQPLFLALKEIEDLRPGYLRGTQPWNPEDGQKCYENYQKIRRYMDEVLGQKGLS
jgi:hypothetical protein